MSHEPFSFVVVGPEPKAPIVIFSKQLNKHLALCILTNAPWWSQFITFQVTD